LPSSGIDMKQYLTNIEISLIEQALVNTNHVVARAATMLNVRRTTLVEKMRKYEIV
jgi:sigma-54 specific flagellar transcriptional regulator A